MSSESLFEFLITIIMLFEDEEAKRKREKKEKKKRKKEKKRKREEKEILKRRQQHKQEKEEKKVEEEKRLLQRTEQLFIKDAQQMYKKMAATIDLDREHRNLTLKEKLETGAILQQEHKRLHPDPLPPDDLAFYEQVQERAN